MIKLFLLACLLPVAGYTPSESIVEVRGGVWPISLEKELDRKGFSYSLIFRDQQVLNEEVLDTLAFSNLEQLKYFEKGLTALKTGSNGDIARFKDYSITRADKKFEGIWYILRDKYGLTNFQQPEADLMSKT